jgi:hypothetical protein
MALITADRVKESATTTGTGNFTLAGAVTGYRAFSVVCANNDTVLYCIAHKTLTEWEVGLGTWQTGGTLVRADANVRSGSAGAGARVNFSAGDKEVFITSPADLLHLPGLSADPAAPGSGVILFSRSKAGRSLPRFIGPSGIETAVQPALWSNSVVMWLPGASTTASIAFGTTWTISATQAHPTIADTNVMTSIRRATYSTTTTAGNASGVRSIAALVLRNRGFYFAARWGILTYSATMQAWCGLGAASGIITGDPSAANNSCGMSKDTGETTWQVFTRDGSTTSKTSTGRTTAAGGSAEVFDFFMFCKPSDSKITFRVDDIAAGTSVLADTEKSSNLPVGTTPMYAHCECRNVTGGAGTAVAIFLAKMYIETDL